MTTRALILGPGLTPEDMPAQEQLRLSVDRNTVAFLADLANGSNPLLGLALLNFNPALDYPPGSLGYAIKQLYLLGGSGGGGGGGSGGPWANLAELLIALTGQIGSPQLTSELLGTIEGLEDTVAGLETTFGETEAAAASAAAALASQIAALASQNAAAVSAGAALTSQTAASTAKLAAETAQAAASTSAGQAATSATSAAGSASTATTQAGIATTAATASGASASAAATSETNAASSATAAGTAASAANTAKLAAETAQAAASTSAGQAASSASTANGAAGVATTQATTATNAATSASNSASSATTQATTATSKAAEASAAATAAETARTQAQTAAGQASTSAGQASSAATDAAGSASSASTSASAAASSASAALGSANAAATSAGSASTSATSASISASAANTAKVAAEAAQAAASVSAGSAASAAASADGSATAAASHYSSTVAATGALTASVSSLSTAVSGPDGLQAQHVWKVVSTRADGKKIFGAIGLASSAVGDAGESQILLVADSLKFTPPGDENATPVQMLELGLVNGVLTLRVPAARIGDATISAGKLAVPYLAAITADMGNLNAGTITLNSSGHIKSGQTAWKTGDGFWMGRDGGEPAFSMGNEVNGGIAYKPSLGTVQLYKPQIIAAPGPAAVMGNHNAGSARVAASGSVTCTAGIEFRADGTIFARSNASGADVWTKVGDWYVPTTSGIGSQFDILFNTLSGSGGTLTGTVGAWQNISGTRSLVLSFTSGTVFQHIRSFTYAVRNTAGGSQIGGGVLTLEISREV